MAPTSTALSLPALPRTLACTTTTASCLTISSLAASPRNASPLRRRRSSSSSLSSSSRLPLAASAQNAASASWLGVGVGLGLGVGLGAGLGAGLGLGLGLGLTHLPFLQPQAASLEGRGNRRLIEEQARPSVRERGVWYLLKFKS